MMANRLAPSVARSARVSSGQTRQFSSIIRSESPASALNQSLQTHIFRPRSGSFLKLAARRFGSAHDLVPPPLTEEDFYLPPHERQAVTELPAVAHTDPTTLRSPQFPTPQLPRTAKRKHPVVSVETGNHLMAEALKEGKAGTVAFLYREMRRRSITPNAETYKHLLASYAIYQISNDAIIAIGEMEMNGVKPDVEIYNGLLNCMVSARQGNSFGISNILMFATRHGIEPNEESYNLLAMAYSHSGDVRRAWMMVQEMKEKGVRPHPDVFRAIFKCSALKTQPWHVDPVIEEMGRLGIPLQPDDLQQVIDICLRNEQFGCLTKALEQAVKLNTKVYIPMIEAIFVVAGRRANPEFAMQAGEYLKQLSPSAQTTQMAYEAVARAQANDAQFSAVFQTITQMSREGMRPREHAYEAIINALSRNLSCIDEAYFHAESLFNSKKQEIDSAALLTFLNLIIEACSQTRQLSKALETFAALDSFGLQPDIDSFHAIFRGVCYTPGHLSTVTQVYNQLLNSGLRPNANTFHHVISAFLVNQELSNAFMLLELAQEQGVEVEYRTYSMIVRKMIRTQREELVSRALSAMEKRGIQADWVLQDYMRKTRTIPKEWMDEISRQMKI